LLNALIVLLIASGCKIKLVISFKASLGFANFAGCSQGYLVSGLLVKLCPGTGAPCEERLTISSKDS